MVTQEDRAEMMNRLDRPLESITPGLEVQTFDGRKLGVVQAVGASGVLIRRRYRDGFWLPEGLVREVNENRVLLHINSRVLPRYSRREERQRVPLIAHLARNRATLAVGAALAGGLALASSL